MRKAHSLLVLGALVVLSFLFLPRLRFATTITHFLPTRTSEVGEAPSRDDAVLAALTEQPAAQTLVVSISSKSGAIEPVAARFLTYLRSHGFVSRVTSAPSEEDQNAIALFLQKQAPYTFLPPEAWNEAAQRSRLVRLKEHLAEPQGALYAKTAPRDPLGGTWDVVEALRAQRQPHLDTHEGVLYTRERTTAFVFVVTKGSAFSAPPQREFLGELRAWAASQPEGVALEFGGVAPYAVASEAQIKGDIQSIGTWSTLGILLLFALLFRSVRMIGLALIPMAVGSLAGLVACQSLYGAVHGITVAFGTSLLGVGIDYSEHYYAHFALAPEEGPFRAMKNVWQSIALGATTTLLGLAGLLFSGSAGLREMAVFSAASIVAAFAATVWLVPPLMPLSYRKPRVLERMHVVAARVALAMVRLGRVPSFRWVTAVVLLGVTVVGLSRAKATDQVDLLMDKRGAHVDEDSRVRARLSPSPSHAVAMVFGTEEELGAKVLAASHELQAAKEQGRLGGFADFASLVPSRAQQERAQRAAKESAPTTRRLLAELEFEPAMFAPYFAALDEAPTYRLNEMLASPLGALVQVSGTGTRYAWSIPLFDVKDAHELQNHVQNAFIVEPTVEVTQVFRRTRRQIAWATAFGVLAIVLTLGIRYRSARLALAACLPTLLSTMLTVGIFALAGTPLHILHWVALLLVLGMGVDYGVFLVDKTQTKEDAARSLVSIVTASFTTILSFGLLAWSSNPGLAALGATVALGVTFSLVLSPLAIALFRIEFSSETEGT